MKRLTVLLVLLGLHAANNLFAQTSQTSGSTEPLRTTFIDSVKEIAAIAPQIPPAGSATLLRSELTATEYQSIIDFSVALKMHNFAELQARIGRGENVPFDEMAAKYFPTTADYQLVAEWLAAQGFTVKPGDVYNLSVFASGSIAAIEHAFGTKFGRVQFAGSEFTSALAAPSLPATVAQPVLSINGLQPHLHPRLHSRFAPAEAEKLINNQPPYTVPEIAKAYKAAGLNANGSGQTIGIVIDTFPADSDLIQFWNDNGINQSLDDIEKIRAVSGTLPSPSGEETLDVEWSSVMAPGVTVRVYATTDLAFSHLDQAYQTIINDLPRQPELRQISLSYGLGELYMPAGQLQADDQYFSTLAAAGVNVFVSSGDGGATPGQNGDTNGPLQVESPASDPNVVAVGGTSLLLNPSTGSVSSESAWSLGGGGSSQFFGRPSWQTGSGVPSGSNRLVPDIALAADPNRGGLLVFNGQLYYVGGTSWSAPMWAGICATINQARFNNFEPTLGRLNPSIYPLIGTNNFRDITTGSNVNFNGTAYYGYSAGSGYDLCTGIGVPNVSSLLQTLAPSANPAPVPVSKDFNGDGQADIVLENSVTGQRVVWILRDAEYGYFIRLPTVDPGWHIANITDFLGNGQADVILENTNTGQHLIWILNGGIYAYTILLPTIPPQWHIRGVSGIVGNSQKNVVLENMSTGQHVVWVVNNGAYTSSIVLPTVSTQWHITGVADYLGTGQANAILENTATGQHILWILNHGTYASTIVLPTVSTQWHVASVADFLGNGQPDVTFENTITGQHMLWVLNSGTYAYTIILPTISTQWKIAGAADFLGNGQAGIALQNIATGQRSIWVLNNGAYAYTTDLPSAPIQWQIEKH